MSICQLFLLNKKLSHNYSDIAYGIPAEDIFDALREVYDFVLSRERKVLALTVPERESKHKSSMESRNDLNKCILKNKDTG